eukprot:5277992-Karenia_brevis.AAC.1
MGASFPEGTWEIFGESDSSPSFVVEFKGNQSTAAWRCEKFLASLCKNNKEWPILQAVDADGDSRELSISECAARGLRAETK